MYTLTSFILLLGTQTLTTTASPFASPRNKYHPRSLPDTEIHTLYDAFTIPPRFHPLSRYLPIPIPNLRSSQGTLIPHPSGTINMESSMNHAIPLTFSISPDVCRPLNGEVECLVKDLVGVVLGEEEWKESVVVPLPATADSESPSNLESEPEPEVEKAEGEAHPLPQTKPELLKKSTNDNSNEKRAGCHTPLTRITETVTMVMNSHTYRATLSLSVLGSLSRAEFEAMMGLLGKIVVSIEKERANRGMERGVGSVSVGVVVEGVEVKGDWTFYEVIKKGDEEVAVKCGC